MRHISLVVGHFEPIQALLEPPLTQDWAMLSPGLGQMVIVNVPRAFINQNLESITPIILVLGHILLVFGHFEPIQALF